MTMSIKIMFGLFSTIAFIAIIVIMFLMNLVSDLQVGIDISIFVIYVDSMKNIATLKVREKEH